MCIVQQGRYLQLKDHFARSVARSVHTSKGQSAIHCDFLPPLLPVSKPKSNLNASTSTLRNCTLFLQWAMINLLLKLSQREFCTLTQERPWLVAQPYIPISQDCRDMYTYGTYQVRCPRLTGPCLELASPTRDTFSGAFTYRHRKPGI